jgi:hypothetical protein
MQESCGRTLRATPRPEGPYAARSPALDFLNVVERGTAAAEDGPAAWRAGWLGFRRDRHVCACRSGQGKTQREIRRCFTRTVARQLYRCWSAGGQSTRREPYVLPRRRQRLNGGGGSGQADRVPADLRSAVLGCSMQQPGRRAARVVVGGTLVVLVALVVAGRMLSGGLQPPAARPTPGNHGADRQLAPHHRTRGRCGGDHPGRGPSLPRSRSARVAFGSASGPPGGWYASTRSATGSWPGSRSAGPRRARSRSRRMPVPCGWWTSAMPGCCASTRLPTGWSPGSRSGV